MKKYINQKTAVGFFVTLAALAAWELFVEEMYDKARGNT